MAISTIYSYFNRIATYISESFSKIIDPKYQKILFTALAVFTAIGTGYLVYQWRNKAVANNLNSRTQDLTKIIHAKVLATIQNAESIPGFKSEEFKLSKHGLIQRWNELVEKKAIVLSGTDKDIRPSTGVLYGLTLNSSANAYLYTIDTTTGRATLVFVLTGGCSFEFGFITAIDFDPTSPDILRDTGSCKLECAGVCG